MSEQNTTSKKCTKCKETKSITEFTNLKRSSDGKSPYCRACKSSAAKAWRESPTGKQYRRKYYAENKDRIYATNREWLLQNKETMAEYYKEYYEAHKGLMYANNRKWAIENRDSYHLISIKHRAKVKGVKCTINEDWIRTHREAGCALTGAQFTTDRSTLSFDTPSVDRIDPNGGYTPDNCRMILLCLNALKHRGTDEEMFEKLGLKKSPSRRRLSSIVRKKYNN
jgi:hypothetical protein